MSTTGVDPARGREAGLLRRRIFRNRAFLAGAPVKRLLRNHRQPNGHNLNSGCGETNNAHRSTARSRVGHSNILQSVPTVAVKNGFRYRRRRKSSDSYKRALPPSPGNPEPIKRNQRSFSRHTNGSRKSVEESPVIEGTPARSSPGGGSLITGRSFFLQVLSSSSPVARQTVCGPGAV